MEYYGRYPNGLGPVFVLFTAVIPQHPLNICWDCHSLCPVVAWDHNHDLDGLGMEQSPSIRSASSTRKQTWWTARTPAWCCWRLTCEVEYSQEHHYRAVLGKCIHWQWPILLSNPVFFSELFLSFIHVSLPMVWLLWWSSSTGSFIYGLFAAYHSLEEITVCSERKGNEVSVTKKEVRNSWRDRVMSCVAGHTEY